MFKKSLLTLAVGASLISMDADACTRVLHVSKDAKYVITGRSMDWYVRYPSTLWKFPRGLKHDGRTTENPYTWTVKYGSIVTVQTAQGQSATSDGMNEKGLVANLLYLTETTYPKRDPKIPGIATSIYVQFLLDNFATVSEAVEFLKQDKIQIVPVNIPGSDHLPTMHVSISDATGDSAIVEFLDGKTVIHHSKKYQIMTNSPTFDQQLALTAYWKEIGGNKFLPGTRNSPDRFVRADFYNRSLPEAKTYKEAIAGVMSVVRNVSSPYGMPDPDKPNISSTVWRTISDHKNLVYFFESTVSYGAVWADFKKFDFGNGKTEMFDADSGLVGDVSNKFKTVKPLEFAKPTLKK